MSLSKLVKTILLCCFFSSCVFERGETIIDLGNRNGVGGSSSGVINAAVSNISIINHQLVINGSNLSQVDTISLDGNVFTIESKTASNIIANGVANFTYALGQLFELVLSSAQGSATFQVTFTLSDNSVTTSKIVDGQVMTDDLADGAVTTSKISTVGATTGSVLQYDGTNWVLVNLNGLTYQGTWDANTNSPSLTDGSGNCDGYNPGDYFAVSVAGSTFLDGENSWGAGDWAICSAGAWDKVTNTTNITSVFGRTGDVTATLSDMTDVDSGLTSVNGQLLIYRSTNSRYETANFLTFDWLNSGNATFSGNVAITGSTLTVGGNNVCLDDGTNCTYPTPTSVVNNSGPAVINSSSGIDSVEFQIGGTTEVSIDTTGKLVTGEFQVQTGAGVGKYLGSDVSGNATWKDIAISEVSGLSTSLSGKVAKTDIPSCTDNTRQLVWDGTSWSCLTFNDTDTNTNAGTICASGEYLDGDGTCQSISAVSAAGNDNIQDDNLILRADNNNDLTGEIQMFIGSGATPSLVIDNSSNVGIGTTTPSQKLHVIGNQYLSGLLEWNNNKGRLTSGAGGVPMLTTVGANDLAIGTNGAGEMMRFDESTGRIGIGTTTPATALEVANNGNATLRLRNSANNFTTDFVTDNGGMKIQMGTTAMANAFFEILAYGGVNSINSRDRDFYIFGDNDAEAFFIEADDGRVGISTNTPLAGTALDEGHFRK
jgi:hypothetical protein